MTTYSLTLREDHMAQLQTHLLRPDGCEHEAYMLCSEARASVDPWDRETHRKFLSCEVITVSDDNVVESTPHLVTWRTTSFMAALKRAEARNQFVVIVHNHPAGMVGFSAQDDANERDLIELAMKRNGGLARGSHRCLARNRFRVKPAITVSVICMVRDCDQDKFRSCRHILVERPSDCLNAHALVSPDQ